MKSKSSGAAGSFSREATPNRSSATLTSALGDWHITHSDAPSGASRIATPVPPSDNLRFTTRSTASIFIASRNCRSISAFAGAGDVDTSSPQSCDFERDGCPTPQ